MLGAEFDPGVIQRSCERKTVTSLEGAMPLPPKLCEQSLAFSHAVPVEALEADFATWVDASAPGGARRPVAAPLNDTGGSARGRVRRPAPRSGVVKGGQESGRCGQKGRVPRAPWPAPPKCGGGRRGRLPPRAGGSRTAAGGVAGSGPSLWCMRSAVRLCRRGPARPSPPVACSPAGGESQAQGGASLVGRTCGRPREWSVHIF